MFLITLDTLTASHSSHEQYADDTGTAWICTKLDGWRKAPPRRTQHNEWPTADGAHRSAAYRGTRSGELAGRLFAPDPATGEQRADAVVALCPDPGERYPLAVQGRDGRTLVAYVEQAGEILCDQTGPAIWDWSVPFVAADPYRYAAGWTRNGPASAGSDGAGGIDFSGSGANFASPGLNMGTAPSRATARATGVGTAENLLVFAVTGQVNAAQVADLSGTSIVGIRGEVPDGATVFVNCSPRVAFDVPGCPTPIPAYGAVQGGANARGAVWITGGWPVLRPGERRDFQLFGATGSGAALTVYTRDTWV